MHTNEALERLSIRYTDGRLAALPIGGMTVQDVLYGERLFPTTSAAWARWLGVSIPRAVRILRSAAKRGLVEKGRSPVWTWPDGAPTVIRSAGWRRAQVDLT